MDRSQLSREFSSRVEVNFQRHPDRFRRATWGVSLLFGMTALAWLVWNGHAGRPEIYQRGGLSKSHGMFESRCEACHRAWSGPLERLLSFGQAEEATSVSDEQCQECHAGAGHFFGGGNELSWEEKATAVNLLKSHSQSCGSCHREHQGPVDLREAAVGSCVSCHVDLPAARLNAHPLEPLTFQHGGRVGISSLGNHPEFGLHDLMSGTAAASEMLPAHGARSVLEYFQRVGEAGERWQDRGRLRFNHAVHLRESGVADARGKTHVLREACGNCHEPESDGRYMRPIRYENHCSSCHPLVFDPGLVQDAAGEVYELDWSGGGSNGRIRSAGEPVREWGLEELRVEGGRFRLLTAPHRSAVEVRGFLTDVYAGGALRKLSEGSGGVVVGGSELARPGRMPALVESASLSAESRLLISRQTAAAEQLVQSANFPRGTGEEIPGLFRSLEWLQGSGGCRYCHETDDGVDGVGLAEGLFVSGAEPLPGIRRPRLPDRWLLHSEFDHDAHRMMTCVSCHSGGGGDGGMESTGSGGPLVPDIYTSRSTGDVLMPQLQLCRRCHEADSSSGLNSRSAGGECLECHVYHQRQFEADHRHGLEKLLRAGE